MAVISQTMQPYYNFCNIFAELFKCYVKVSRVHLSSDVVLSVTNCAVREKLQKVGVQGRVPPRLDFSSVPF